VAAFAAGQPDMPYVDPTAVREAATELAKPFGSASATGEGSADGDADGNARGEDRGEDAGEVPRKDAGEDPYRLHEELQATMGALVGIFRTETDLDEAIRRVGELRARWNDVRISGGRAYNPSWGLVYETRNMLIVSEAVARSAKERRESRGAHSRIDYPDPDPAWARQNIAARRAGETMEIVATPLPALPDDLRQLIATESH
jgi:succinate dehydrogenase / fumarate reductase flavoprotein subunit